MKLNKKNLLILVSIAGLPISSYADSPSPLPLDIRLRCKTTDVKQITRWHVSISNKSLVAIKIMSNNSDTYTWTSPNQDNGFFTKEIIINPKAETVSITQTNDCEAYPVSGLKLRNISIKKNDLMGTVLKSVNIGLYTGAMYTYNFGNKRYQYDTSQFSNLDPLTYEAVNANSAYPNFVWGIPREDVISTPQMNDNNFVAEPTPLTFLPNTDWNGEFKDVYMKFIYNDGGKLELDTSVPYTLMVRE